MAQVVAAAKNYNTRKSS